MKGKLHQETRKILAAGDSGDEPDTQGVLDVIEEAKEEFLTLFPSQRLGWFQKWFGDA